MIKNGCVQELYVNFTNGNAPCVFLELQPLLYTLNKISHKYNARSIAVINANPFNQHLLK